MLGILVKVSWSWSLSSSPKGLVGLPLSFAGFGKTSSTTGISAEEESVGRGVIHLVVHVYN